MRFAARLVLLAGALVGTGLAADAAAQVNTERMRGALDGGLALGLDASAAFATGNAEYVLLGLGGRADARRGPDLAFVVGRFDLSQTGGAAFVDRQFAHARYNRDVGGPLVVEAFGQVERNRQRRLAARTLVGGGLRLEALDRDSVGLALGLTPMLEVERLSDTDAEAGTDAAARVRLSTYLAGRLALASGAALSATVYAQPRADAPGDVRVLGQLALDVPVVRAVRLRVSADLRTDTRPPAGVAPTDLVVQNGLVVTLPAR